MPNLADWLTKQEVATALSVSTKTVEKYAADGKLQQAKRPQFGGPPASVYHPGDVERLIKERQLPAHVVPSNGTVSEASGSSSDTSQSLARTGLGELNQNGHALVAALTEVLREGFENHSQKLFLTIKEASHLSGLTQAYLERAIKAETLPVIRDGRRIRIRRKDVEGL